MPRVNGASSTNHQTKKGTTISVKEERCTPIKGEKHLRDEPEDSEDDMPLSSRLSVRSDNGNCNMVGEGKHSNGDSGDSDDDKPLSVRLSSGLAKGNSRLPERGSVAGEPSDTQNLKSVVVKSPNDSDDEKPLLSRLPAKSSAGTSSRKYDDSAEGKHLAHQNGCIKRENEIKKVPFNSAKRPSDASSGQSSIKKVKLSDASTSGKVKQIKEEQKDDDDHIPIAQRMNKASSGSKLMAVKKTLAKVDSSKLKKVDKKSKKIMKKSKYSKLSKELPNSGDGQKWTTLAHNGVIFPPLYQPHGVKMLYDGKPVDLTPEQEEVATMYAVMLETDYIKKEKFNENFFNDWKKLLGKNHVIQELKKCDFRPIYDWHLKEKEKKKQMSSEEKKALKEEKLKQEEKYMLAQSIKAPHQPALPPPPPPPLKFKPQTSLSLSKFSLESAKNFSRSKSKIVRSRERQQWCRRTIWTKCSSARTIGMSGTLILCVLSRPTLLIAVLRFSVRHVLRICCENGPFIMICQDMYAAQVICLAVVGVVRAAVLNFVLLLRSSAALGIRWPLHVFCYRMSSIYRQQSVITASLVSCSA